VNVVEVVAVDVIQTPHDCAIVMSEVFPPSALTPQATNLPLGSWASSLWPNANVYSWDDFANLNPGLEFDTSLQQENGIIESGTTEQGLGSFGAAQDPLQIPGGTSESINS
jgi:hypothetical protein